MARNIVICFDGTSNEFGKVDTNVVRLVEVADRDQLKQRVYYDPGVGTLPEPGVVTCLGKKLWDLLGLAFGVGILWKVQEAYGYLMDIWEPGDQVFIFGFSRGAYSARVLAAILHAFGLLPQGNQNMVPYLMRLFKGARNERKNLDNKMGPWQKLCDDFRWTFARQVTQADEERHFPVHFVGVWDTVSSVGWVWNPDKFPYTATNPSIKVARHAVSLDERRSFFWQNLFKQAEGQDLREVWFAGSHCDVGGGYPEIEKVSTRPEATASANPNPFAGSWRCSFLWMIAEAKKYGLLISDVRLKTVLSRMPPCEEPWKESIHDALIFPWTLTEFVPKWVWNPQSNKSHLRCGLGRRRDILEGALIHKTVLLRIRETNYQPSNLSNQFQTYVKSIAGELPEAVAYKLI